MASIFTLPRERVTDGNGRPYPGAKAYFYNAGTLVSRTVYQNNTLTTPHAQPVVADSGGLMPLIYLPSGAYKVIVTQSDDTLIYEADNQDAVLTTTGGVLGISSGGTGAATAAAALAALGAAAQTALDALAATVASLSATISAYPSFGALAARNKLLNTDLETTDFGPVCIQRSITTLATRSSLSGSIPRDNTTPLRSEGDTAFTVLFTPKKSTSTLRVRAELHLSGNGANRDGAIALFAPGVAAGDSAIAAMGVIIGSSSISSPFQLQHEFTSGQTTQMTIQVNMGASGAYVLNGLSGGGLFNGVMFSRLIIEEFHQP